MLAGPVPSTRGKVQRKVATKELCYIGGSYTALPKSDCWKHYSLLDGDFSIKKSRGDFKTHIFGNLAQKFINDRDLEGIDGFEFKLIYKYSILLHI